MAINTSGLSGYALHYANAVNQGFSDADAHTYATYSNGGSGLTLNDIAKISSGSTSNNKTTYTTNKNGQVANSYQGQADALANQLYQQQQQQYLQQQPMGMYPQMSNQQYFQSLLSNTLDPYLKQQMSLIQQYATPTQTTQTPYQKSLTQENARNVNYGDKTLLTNTSNMNVSNRGGGYSNRVGYGNAINRYLGGNIWGGMKGSRY